jgi:eukaryotic-like serine/threonine-protein kinase
MKGRVEVLPTLTEQYRVVKRLGVGAMGDVYCVENLAAQRFEAMKVLKKIDDPNIREVAQARFKREVRAGHRLSHPNIVPTFDCGELPDGRLYLTMEFVDGPSLAQVLHQRGTLPVPLVLGILTEIADAVNHAHRAGVIHRDIKPHNILLPFTQHGPMVKVLDLGLAKILFGDFKESLVLSKEGVAFGTPQYMSPEQCRGARPDPRSDIYALGCVAYELLTGKPPFTGNIAMIFMGQLKNDPVPMKIMLPEAKIPRQLDQIVLQCLQKSPETRFQNGFALYNALQSVPGYQPLRA